MKRSGVELLMLQELNFDLALQINIMLNDHNLTSTSLAAIVHLEFLSTISFLHLDALHIYQQLSVIITTCSRIILFSVFYKRNLSLFESL